MELVGPDDNHLANKLTVSRYTKNGKLISTTLLDTIPTKLGGQESQVSASMDANGNAAIAYSVNFEAFNVTPPSPSGSIKIIRISSDGVVSPAELIADGRVGTPSVSMDDGGGYYVAWEKHWIASDPTESIQVCAFSADGTRAGRGSSRPSQRERSPTTISTAIFSEA